MRTPFALLSIVVGSSIQNTAHPRILLQEGAFSVLSSSSEGSLMISLKSGKCSVDFAFENMVIFNLKNLLRVIKSQFPNGTFRNRNACLEGSDSQDNNNSGYHLRNSENPTELSCDGKSRSPAAIVIGKSVPESCAEKIGRRMTPLRNALERLEEYAPEPSISELQCRSSSRFHHCPYRRLSR